MVENIDTSLIDWSRAQFALTAIDVYKRQAKNEQPTDNMDTHFQKTSL